MVMMMLYKKHKNLINCIAETYNKPVADVLVDVLNTESQIYYHYGNKERDVRLTRTYYNLAIAHVINDYKQGK